MHTMFKNGFRFCTFLSATKWNLLFLYVLLILCTIVVKHKLSYQFQSWSVSLKPQISFNGSAGKLKGENASLEFYDIRRPVRPDLNCIKTRTTPSVTVCLYSQWHDKYISHDLEFTGIWEPQIVDDFLEVLRRDKDAGVLDIGANIGYYTMLAATMGHQVVAVEPLVDSIHRIHQAAQLEKVCERITILRNAVADVRMSGTVRKTGDNQGDTRIELRVEPCQGSCPPTVKTILLDDLVHVAPFKRAVMKVDIQGYEHRAFQHAAVLFNQINITYVFMEWLVMKEYFALVQDHSEDVVLVEDLLSFFFHRNYRPYSLSTDGGFPLDPSAWPQWPNDIVWHLMPGADLKSKLLHRSFYQWP